MNGWQRNGANPQWTTEQMMEALARVYATVGACGIAEYRTHRRPTDPTPEGITARFGAWNRAKVKAGLPITIRAGRGRKTVEGEADEAELIPQKQTTYPCWRCHRPFKGVGRRKGQWHCEYCREQLAIQAASMGW